MLGKQGCYLVAVNQLMKTGATLADNKQQFSSHYQKKLVELDKRKQNLAFEELQSRLRLIPLVQFNQKSKVRESCVLAQKDWVLY